MPRRVRPLLAAAVLGMLVATLSTGTAGATLVPGPTPEPSMSAPSADPAVSPAATVEPTVTEPPAPTPTDLVAPSPEPTPVDTTPVPAPSASESIPVPPVPSPLATAVGPLPLPAPVPAPTPAMTPGVPAAAAPAETRIPLPPSDGVVPDIGQVDEYLDLTAQRDQLAARVLAARTALATTRTAISDLVAQRTYAASVAAGAEAVATANQADVEDVARDMYQQGDGGLGALATVLTSGPEGLINRLDNVRLVRSTARGVIQDAATSRAEMALANATELALTLRIDASAGTEAEAVRDLGDAEASLAAVDARLAALSIGAPQQRVGPDGCPTENVPGTLRDGSDVIGAAALCRSAVRQAATPQAALAITWAFTHLGAPYACGGAGRLLPFRMDCSSFASRAYAEGAGLRTAGAGWAPSTRNMVPWDGISLDPHYAYVPPTMLRAGDLVLYDTCPQGGCPYKHVVMYLGSPDGGKSFWMAHTNACGDIAKIETFWGFPSSGRTFLVARRVIALPGESVSMAVAPKPAPAA